MKQFNEKQLEYFMKRVKEEIVYNMNHPATSRWENNKKLYDKLNEIKEEVFGK